MPPSLQGLDSISLLPVSRQGALPSSSSPSRFAYKVPHESIQVVSAFSSTLGKAYWVPVDHLGGPVYEFLYALSIINSF